MAQYGRSLDRGMKSVLEEAFAPQAEGGRGLGDGLDWARNRFIDFCRYVQVEPQFIVNWHHEVIAAHLEQVLEGKIRKLMVLAPPQHTKSMMVSELFPAYAMGKANEAIATAAFT